MRLYVCVCFLALFSLDELANASNNKNSYSREKDEDHVPVRNTMDINPDEEMEGGSGDGISIEGSGSPPPNNNVDGSETEIVVLNLRVTNIEGKKAKFSDELLDNTSPLFIETAETVCNGVYTIVNRENGHECRVLKFYEGSIVATTQLKIVEDSTLSLKKLETVIKDAANKGEIGSLTIDPKSVSISNPYTTVVMTSTRSPEMDSETTTKKYMKPKARTTDEFVFEMTETTTQMIEVQPTEITESSFFDKLFDSPVLLAGMVGAAVLILLTMILLSMFIVYRVKKKDEGSYSLDEPNKKDPQAYWKDTKEFYA
ncbi:uncharacterized protein [Antedon mediterranea]|uniref:uncharacterized protein isoform X2 n=1 Tax=Antedon mediterranea TaxID=105859 RepID=UPI003AF7D4F9